MNPDTESLTGYRIEIRGLVQGVGFRPNVWRLAQQQGLTGRVFNSNQGVVIEAFGPRLKLEQFQAQLAAQAPTHSQIREISTERISWQPHERFIIDRSAPSAAHTEISPDLATCSACLQELFDPNDRRYRYPFINCTECGPRLSILHQLPYDRINTSLAGFSQCPECLAEYQNPADRRFHAQPNACPCCGPQIWFQSGLEHRPVRIAGDAGLQQAVELLRAGQILALKGLGGFHLICDATQESAVRALRQRKRRTDKPFALMARDLEVIERCALVSETERSLLQSPAAPLVLLERRQNTALSEQVAPRLDRLAIMLPHTPLHHLLLAEFDHPLVATSGNVSGLPPCIENEQALEQLAQVADGFLLHDRPIINRLDDSLVAVMDDGPQMLRRARGYAPKGGTLPPGFENAKPILAYGATLKSTFCQLFDGRWVLSQHLGDLDNGATLDEYRNTLKLYRQLHPFEPEYHAVDRHPGYLSSQLARQTTPEERLIEVQHHHAHIASCLAEQGWGLNQGPVVGIALDGLGLGDQGALWGGEILVADYRQYESVARLAPVAMPGGERAVWQPWRSLVAQLYQGLGAEWRDRGRAVPLNLERYPLDTLEAMLAKGFNSPKASSCGRLFDAVAAALGICTDQTSYEGQAAIELEACTSFQHCLSVLDQGYPFSRIETPHGLQIDAAAIWPPLLDDLQQAVPRSVISARFHVGLCAAFSQEAIEIAQQRGLKQVALTGGVMQNRWVGALLGRFLSASGLEVLRHRQIPANDGGLALGQALICAAQTIKGEASNKGLEACV